MQSLDLWGDASAEQVAVLELLRPTQLHSLSVIFPAEELVAALPRFPQLSLLGLGNIEDDLPSGVAAALSQRNQLRALILSSNSIPAQLTAAMVSCSALSMLSVAAGYFEEPQALRQLSRLRQLSSLRLAAGETCLHVPEPALLPALSSFEFRCTCDEPSESAGVQVSPALMLA